MRAALSIPKGLPDAGRVRDPESRRVLQALVDALRAASVSIGDPRVAGGGLPAAAGDALRLVAGQNIELVDLGNGRWRISASGGGSGSGGGNGDFDGVTMLGDLDDVTLDDAAEGDLLQRDADGVWQRVSPGVIDVEGTAAGQILVWTLIDTDPDVYGWTAPEVGTLADKDVLEWNATGQKFVKLTPTEVTMITQVRYNMTDKRLERKTRTIKVLAAGAEDENWTMLTGGQAVELPE